MQDDVAEAGARGGSTRHVLVTVHGIRTFGGWQSRLAKIVRDVEPNCEIRSFSFNYFSALAFWFPPTRWLVVRRFARALDHLAASGSPDRLDIVAHSFGTHVVAWGLRRTRRPLRVHTLILSGSVLRASHFWEDLIPARVGRLVNECGHRDSILILSQAFVPLTGMAGRVGFVGLLGPEIQNRYFEFGHSGYFEGADGKPDDGFMREHWLPLLTGDGPVPTIDRRGEATPLTGIQLTLLQWLDPVKMAVVWGMVALAFLFLVGLWASAAMTRDRLGAATDLIRSASSRGLAIDSTAVQSVVAALGLPLGTSHVLWVDDNPENNSLERRALGRWNVCFTNVRSTSEAVRILEMSPGRHALVISDWARQSVPGDEGSATAAAIARLPAETRPALIFYVSPTSVTAQNREAARRLGAIDETGDPFVLSALSLGAIASQQAIGDGGWSSRLPASLVTGLSWLRRKFLACSND
jgi:CheY-like chemotaxis protein